MTTYLMQSVGHARLFRSRTEQGVIEITPADVRPAAGDIPFDDAVGLVAEGFCPCRVPQHEPGHRLTVKGWCDSCGCKWSVSGA